MFPKPPRPEPPRRAVAMQVVQQRTVQRVPDTLVVERPLAPPAKAAVPAPAGHAGSADSGSAPPPPAEEQPV